MSIAKNQELPTRPQEEKTWTRKAVFPISGAVNVITKHFSNPLDVLSLISISAIIILELIGRNPYGLYFLSSLTITLSFLNNKSERQDNADTGNN